MKFFSLALLVLWACTQSLAAETVSLAGEWRFALDRSDVGVNERWYDRDLNDRVRLPGVLQSQGYGDEVSTETPWVLSLYDRFWFQREDFKPYTKPGNVKVPFLSQPPRHYLGAAWYQRDIEVPQSWEGRRVVLFMERPRWESTLWINDLKIGSDLSLSAPHIYDLGTLAPGTHRLTVRVDSRMLMSYRPDAHSVSDSLASSWNGIVGRIELRATTPVWIEDAQVFPNVAKRSVVIKVAVGNATGEAGKGTFSAGSVSLPVTWNEKGTTAELEVSLGSDAKLWDEFNPVLHRLTLNLKGQNADDSRNLVFGLREFGTEGNEFIINGRKIHLRGTHHGGDFPLTGYPATDVESWRRILRTSKEWGLNHVRFHSWAPPKAAFEAADELGIYLQAEPGMWNVITPGTPMEKMLYEETERMIKEFGNHPSFVLLSASNEPKGHWKKSLPPWAEHFRNRDARRLYTTGTGQTDREIPDPMEGNDYLILQRLGQKMLRGNTAWFGRDYRQSLEDITIPMVSHELGQWVAYPDYDIIKKFTGYMRPSNYEIFRDSMAARGLLKKNKDFALASGQFQVECYKEEIEANLRTPGMGGFQLLDIRDYLGQGTALVGVIDAFWENKGYVTAKEFRRFNNSTVPLARLRKRVFTTAEQFLVDLELAHYGPQPLDNAVPIWKVLDQTGRVVVQGDLPARSIPLGKNLALGQITVDLSKLKAPMAYKLVVGLKGTEFENNWNFWVYPANVDETVPADVLITRSWDVALTRLAAGGKVLFTPPNSSLYWTSPPLDRVPVFWNRLMGPAWGRMLGTWNDTRHPALAGFPTENHFDWQWAELIRNVRAVNLDRLPPQLEPIVWAIDDWNRNYKLGLIFETRVGPGRLLISSFSLLPEGGPVARQLRRSLLNYMASNRFKPNVAISPSDLRGLMFDTRIMTRLGAEAKGEAQETNPPAHAIDGDPNTYWWAGDQKGESQHPHELIVNFPRPVAMSGLVVMPRQNHREHEGDIREYVIHISENGSDWKEFHRGELVSTFDPQSIFFSQTLTTRHLKLTALSGFGVDKTAALAELAVIYAGPRLANSEGEIEYRRSRTATPDIDEGADPDTKPPETIVLWPEGAPGALGKEPSDIPTLTSFLPTKEKATGAAIIVCPGGGYARLADHEGRPVAEWLNSIGVTAFVLKYRHGARYPHPAPLLDAARATRTVRAKASEWNLDLDRIGILGFSAGGHLASTAATHFDSGKADATDPIERVSSRPNLLILIYPVITMRDLTHAGSKRNLLGPDPSEALVALLSNDEQVTPETPPTFLVHTVNDAGVPVENSLLFAAALRKKQVPFELHLYERGAHGFGLGGKDPILATWPERLAAWLSLRGFIGRV